eukprot:TRINITY_DN70767_c0_g1_i1.p1 TRINITY_DN70767_c0_g1~~TRINITY_DN70767_c0_g1_i1.p1  ORF type:complete len:1650 (+),score=295.74 TRINITY_DN70767_c0_g1_i1:43-4950(+)
MQHSPVATAPLPLTFLRSLEADLRALCADARKKNPALKQAAERVILLLKEADDHQSQAHAADQAAAVFCTACEAPEPSPLPSSSAALQLKVSLRAVACLHRLITHRTLTSHTLPHVLDALQRLSSPCFDDNVTLKVLQSLLSLLTVRSYTRALSEHHLSRAFSMLFQLQSVRNQTKPNAASTALSAISQFSAHSSSAAEKGIIEQTAKAAFRQVSSDLFAAAADATVRTAVERHAASGQFIPLAAFPSEATAAFSLFLDLCHAISAEDCEWLSTAAANASQPLDITLALEVIDDSLATNISLFGGQPVFSELVLARLCPVVHKLLHTTNHRTVFKSLLSLVVTLVRNYWSSLRPDAETFCHALTNMARLPAHETDSHTTARLDSWSTIYAIEALRCIFRSTLNESSPLIDFTRTFDLAQGEGKCVSAIIALLNDHISLTDMHEMQLLPAPPITATMKPFAKLIANTPDFIVSIAIGLHIEIVKAAEEAVRNQLFDVTAVLLPEEVTANIVTKLGKLLQKKASPRNLANLTSSEQDAQMNAFRSMLDCIAKIAVVSDACKFDHLRETAITTLCSACAQSARSKPSANEVALAGTQLQQLFKTLFEVASQCKTSLGRAWVPVIDALDHLDTLNEKRSTSTDRDTKAFSSSAKGLDEKIRALMSSTSELPWDSCHDLISALVRCSRQSVAQLGKKGNGDDSSRLSSDASGSVRLFGIVGAEIAILSALKRTNSGEASVPSALWQLFTGHLTSICVDATLQSLRAFALASLTKIACGALDDDCNIVIAHERIVRPFLDLLSSPFADVHSGTLSSVYSILETHGEHLKGDAAWRIILQILSIATGTNGGGKGDRYREPNEKELQNGNGAPENFESSPETVSDGFKLVQFIADDFLSSITKSSFPVWLDLLGLCSSQMHDMNVALTSIGLLWRTADFIAKVGEVGKDDDLWVALFQVLKEVSMDERPEIRNCAVKTLTGALSAHSSRLSAVAWNGCVEKALLPLLEEVMQGGSASTAEDSPALAKSRSDVQLLLHHSRDTPRKQWNETRVLALAGVAKLLRTAMPRLSVLKDENNRPLFMMLTDGGTGGLWRKMLRAAGVAAASRDGEVAVAGVSALLELLNAAGLVVERPSASAPELSVSHADRASSLSKPSASSFWIPSFAATPDGDERNTSDEDPEETKRVGTVSLWEAVWCALREATGGGQLVKNEDSQKSDEKKLEVVDERALRILSEGLISARKRLADKFTPSSSRVLVEVLMVLSLGRQTTEAVRSAGAAEGVSKVQDVTLQGLEELSFGNDEASWSALIEGMLGIVLREDISRGSRHDLSTRILRLLSRMYQSNETPAAVKASQTANVLRVLGKLMVGSSSQTTQAKNIITIGENGGVNKREKDEENSEPLWIQATEVVIVAMKQGSEERGTCSNNEIWQEFGRLVMDMLFTERKRGYAKNFSTVERERREANDMRLVECVKDGLSRMGSSTSATTKQGLVRILARGAQEGQSRGRPRFVRGCQKRLFQLADGAEENKTHAIIKEECGKCVVETCSRVLGQYNADGHRAGKCPLPAGRRAEAVFLLQQLRKMKRTDGWAQHLTCLYARLCECVDSRDEAVRWLAKEVLDESAPVTQATESNKGGVFRKTEVRV